MKIKQIIVALTCTVSIIQIKNIRCAAIEQVRHDKALEKRFRLAASSGNIPKLMECLDLNVNVNSADNFVYTALMYAALYGQEEVVKMLLEYQQDDSENRVNVNAVNKKGETALMLAAKYGRPEIVRMLLEYKKDKVNVNVANKYGDTALIYAADNGHTEIVKMLLKDNQDDPLSRVDVNAANNEGETALILAARCDNHGPTALMWAGKIGHTEMVRMLLEYKQYEPLSRVDVNAADNKGFTALMLAASEGYEAMADMLLKDPRIDVNKGKRKVEIQ